MTSPRIIHLRNGGTSVVIELPDDGLPAIIHWGQDLGQTTEATLGSLARATHAQVVSGGLDVPARVSVLPLQSSGWLGDPGLAGSRDGADFSPLFALTETVVQDAALQVTATDTATALEFALDLAVTATGLLTQRLTLTNTGATGYQLDQLACSFPVPTTATELLDTVGRHLRERTPQRHPFTDGRFVRESRSGRPGFDATLLLTAGTPGFGFERGLVHAVHVAWSGNYRLSAERGPQLQPLIQAGELLGSREIILAPGESYSTPLTIGSWGDGLTELSARLHGYLRERASHPSSPRPVTFNTWEAVYFKHDLTRLTELADAAAAVGAERFVLDDGWFRGRRDDTSSLGDWYVDAEVWPDGLHALFGHVAGLGMQCGLWVEPEMVNLDSDLARAHPNWILQSSGRMPVESRYQQVLDLGNPDVFSYLLERLDALLEEYPIDYLKWDHNRDLLEAGSTVTQRPATHETVEALYRLFDELKSRHPGLEIESCASGGARVDLGILNHTDRIWTSDCIDPLERLTIQKYTGLLVPYELMGAHISGPESHSTGRRHDLSFRAGVALFGHLGVEWNILDATSDERDDLAEWIELHKRWRARLHTGRAVYADLPDVSMDLRGVVAPDDRSALFVFSQVTTSASYPPGPIHLPGLADTTTYSVRMLESPRTTGRSDRSTLAWTEGDTVLTGAMLRTVGVQAPVLRPEHLVLIEVLAVE